MIISKKCPVCNSFWGVGSARPGATKKNITRKCPRCLLREADNIINEVSEEGGYWFGIRARSILRGYYLDWRNFLNKDTFKQACLRYLENRLDVSKRPEFDPEPVEER